MNHAAAMGVRDGVTDLAEHLYDAAQRRLRKTDVRIQRLAAHIIHREEVAAVSDPAVVNDNDVGMPKRGDQFHLALESPSSAFVGEWSFKQYLDRDGSPRSVLHGLVYHALAAAMNLANDVVAGNAFRTVGTVFKTSTDLR